MSDLVRRLSIPNEIAVFMWKPFLLPGENQRDYENASPNDDRRHPAKAALKEAKSSADSVISNGGAVWSIKFHCGLRHLSGLAQQDWVSSGRKMKSNSSRSRSFLFCCADICELHRGPSPLGVCVAFVAVQGQQPTQLLHVGLDKFNLG